MTNTAPAGVILMAVACLLAACILPGTRPSPGDDAAATNATGAVQYAALAPIEHARACEAHLTARRYEALDRCLPVLRARIDAGETLAIAKTFSPTPEYLLGAIDILKARGYLERGEPATAAKLAERIYRTARTGDLARPAPEDRTIISMLLFEKRELPEQDMRTIRNRLAIPALGIAASAHALNGDRPAGREAVVKLTAIHKETSSDGVTTVMAVPDPMPWIARYYYVYGDYRAADEWLTATPNADSGIFGGRSSAAGTLRNRLMAARTAFERGKLEQARRGYDGILAVDPPAGFDAFFFAASFDRGRIAIAEGDINDAIRYFARAMELLERPHAAIGRDRYMLGPVGDPFTIYTHMIEAQLALGEVSKAFSYAERAKAWSLTTLGALEPGSLRLAATNENGPGAGAIKTGIRAVSVADIQAVLSDQEVLIEYHLSDDRLTAFVVTGTTAEAVELDGYGLADAVIRFHQSLRDGSSDAWLDQAGALYARLVPLEARVGAPIMTVVPHGPLHYLPFATLHDGRDVLANRIAVRVLPSAGLLRHLRGQGVSENRALLAFGHVGTEAQTKAVVERWSSAQRLLQRDASETALKVGGGAYGYLHLAGDTTFDAAAPLASAVQFAPDDQNDGRLTVSEIFALNLDAELVTLSAGTATPGEAAAGDEVIAMTHGFLHAGARSVLAGLWRPPEEATTFLMERFYENLNRMGRAEALRKAQLAARDKYGHPYYWAAFQLSGNG